MQRRNKYPAGTRLALLLAFTAAVGAALGADGAKARKIAVACPLTGAQAKAGLDIVQAVRLAVEQANAAKLPTAPSFEVVEFDDQSNPTQAALVARKAEIGRAHV